MADASTIVSVTAGRALPSYAAVVAVDVAFTESSLRNTTTQSDHDSEGLFQQRISLYTKAVADDPVQATGAFLDRLIHVPGWQNKPVETDAQAVQISQRPSATPPHRARPADRRATVASAAATPKPSLSVTTAADSAPGSTGTSTGTLGPAGDRAVPRWCAGRDGGVPLTGGHGNNVAGTTTVPPGLRFTGTARATRPPGSRWPTGQAVCVRCRRPGQLRLLRPDVGRLGYPRRCAGAPGRDASCRRQPRTDRSEPVRLRRPGLIPGRMAPRPHPGTSA